MPPIGALRLPRKRVALVAFTVPDRSLAAIFSPSAVELAHAGVQAVFGVTLAFSTGFIDIDGR